MEVTEELILCSLILGDINDLRNFCDDYVKKYYGKFNPIKSISHKKYLDFLTDFHSMCQDFMERYK